MRRLITRSVAIIPAAFVIYRGRARHLRAAHTQPGDPQHAAAVRHHPAHPVHQRPRANGCLCQSRLGEALAWIAASIIVGLNI